MSRAETLKDMLVALQADLCIQGALTLADEIKTSLSSPARPLPTPHQIAVNLMSRNDGKGWYTNTMEGAKIRSKITTDHQGHQGHT